MKAGLITAAVGLAGFTAAHGAHHARHEEFHHKREMVYETVTDLVTDMTEEIIYYVDGSGKTVSSTTIYKTMSKTQAPPAPSTTVVAVSSSAAASPSSAAANFLAAQPVPASSAPAASPAAPTSAAASSSSSSDSGSSSGSKPANGAIGFGSGISYSPYNADHSCKSVSQIKQDLSSINMDVIRLYGTDCSQVENTLDAIKGKNSQLFVGIFDVGSAISECQTIINAVKTHCNGDWSSINTVSVGNEVVNNGGSVGQVAAAVTAVRAELRAAGFQGPVVTVDTMVAHKANPGLCEASDYCAMNCHAFFDGNTEAAGAGDFVAGWVKQIGSAHPDKKVIVTETGWPSQGSTNGKAVPSESNQQAAVSSLKSSFSSNMILYSAYNQMWMTSNAAQFNAEQYWGIHGMAPSS